MVQKGENPSTPTFPSLVNVGCHWLIPVKKISFLFPETATEIRDLLLRPPEDNPYDILEQKLIERIAASEQHQLQQLFPAEELGDQKHMQLLHRM